MPTDPHTTTDRIDEHSTSRSIDVGGLPVHYHEAGDGPTLLCLHGGAPGAFGWGNFGRSLPWLADHFRTIIVDLPGYGGSAPRSLEGGRYTALADVFAAFLDTLGIDRAHVMGMATGGAVAMMLAVNHPQRVARLVLVSTAGGLPLFSVMPSEGQKAIRSYYDGEGPSLERMRAYLELMMYDSALITDELVEERYRASVANGPVTDGATVEQPWRQADRIKAPTLIVWGRENRVQGFDNGLFLLKQIPRSDFHVMGNTGLWVPFERPRAFASVVTGHLIAEV